MNRNILYIICTTLFLIHCVQKPKDSQSEPSRDPSSTTFSTAQKELEPKPFEICKSPRKNYLEKQILQSVPADYLANQDGNWDRKIPLRCIQFAQKNFVGSYAYCKNEDERPLIGYPRPCLTENYTRLVYNAYHDVKNCFNLDPRRSFLQIMVESGFHINAINKTGFDAGISQFTKNGILRVMDKNILKKTQQELLLSSSASCQRISNIFNELEHDAFKVTKRCSMMVIPENPYRALVLHYLHTLKDQIYFKNEFLKNRPEIAAVMNQDIIEQLVYLAYNRGITGTLRLIDGYVKSRKEVNHTIVADDLDLWKNLSEVKKILAADPTKRVDLKKAKIKNLTFAEYAVIQDKTYLSTMSEARDLVKKHLGSDCF